jgi:hypothetical protein
MVSENEEEKQRLMDLLAQAPAAAKRVAEQAEQIQQTAHFIGEAASADLDLLKSIPAESLPLKELSRKVETWQTWHDGVGRVVGNLNILSSEFDAASYAASGTNTSTISYIVASQITWTPEMQGAVARMDKIFERAPLFTGAQAELRRLGLDKQLRVNRAALELLNEAKRGLDTGHASALLTMRESIRAAISELVRRRPQQEPAGSLEAKLASIGRQCAQPGLDGGHFERLGGDGRVLLYELSGTKQKRTSPQDVSVLFHRGLVFLNALLRGIDEKLLRP